MFSIDISIKNFRGIKKLNFLNCEYIILVNNTVNGVKVEDISIKKY